jgi:hypothetical protein
MQTTFVREWQHIRLEQDIEVVKNSSCPATAPRTVLSTFHVTTLDSGSSYINKANQAKFVE